MLFKEQYSDVNLLVNVARDFASVVALKNVQATFWTKRLTNIQ